MTDQSDYKPIDGNATPRDMLIRLDERLAALQRDMERVVALERRTTRLERNFALQRDKLVQVDKRAGHQFDDDAAIDLNEMRDQWVTDKETGLLMRRGVQNAIIGGCITIILFVIIGPIVSRALGIGL